jgi:hypothetical protein
MNRPFHRHRTHHGMVLIEVVTALFIFTMVAFALVMALDAAMDAAKLRNQIDTVMRGLANQLALIRAAPLFPSEKDAPDDGSGIAYHLQIAPEQLKDQKGQLVSGIYRVTITAAWKFGGQAEDRSVSELIFQP